MGDGTMHTTRRKTPGVHNEIHLFHVVIFFVGHDVQIAYELEEARKHPELLILGDLLQAGLRQPLGVLSILTCARASPR